MAKELFDRLRNERPADFRKGQLRTLQRRVKEWRRLAARRLVLAEPLRAHEAEVSHDVSTVKGKLAAWLNPKECGIRTARPMAGASLEGRSPCRPRTNRFRRSRSRSQSRTRSRPRSRLIPDRRSRSNSGRKPRVERPRPEPAAPVHLNRTGRDAGGRPQPSRSTSRRPASASPHSAADPA